MRAQPGQRGRLWAPCGLGSAAAACPGSGVRPAPPSGSWGEEAAAAAVGGEQHLLEGGDRPGAQRAASVSGAPGRDLGGELAAQPERSWARRAPWGRGWTPDAPHAAPLIWSCEVS